MRPHISEEMHIIASLLVQNVSIEAQEVGISAVCWQHTRQPEGPIATHINTHKPPQQI